MAPTEARVTAPDVVRPLLISACFGVAAIVALHAASRVATRAAAEAGAPPALSALAFPAEHPLVYIVAGPAAILVAYGLLQLAAYRALLLRLSDATGGRGALLLRAAGRDPDEAPVSFDRLRLTDRILLRPIEFGVGATTMLGLLGTVIGLTLAIQGMPAVLSDAVSATDRGAVLESLGLAFVTTIIGIVASLLLSLIRLAIQTLADQTRVQLAGNGSAP